MDARTLVKQTLEFASPLRIPRQLWLLPWAHHNFPEQLAEIQKRFPDDIISAPTCLRSQLKTTGDAYEIGTYVDEWGSMFLNQQRGYIGEVKEPVINSYAELDRLRLPIESLTVDVEQVNAFCRQTDRYVMAGCCPRPFERMQFLRTSSNLFLDLGEQKPEMLSLLKRIHEFYLQELDVWASTEVDGLMFMDDWGAQRALLISPHQWRQLFRPLYQDYIDLAHSRGKAIWMHSDGYIADIIPDLVEMGLDALNSQLFVMDIEDLGARFRGKLTFWGEIDRQHLLPYGTPSDIHQAVRRIKEALYAEGGVVAQCEFGVGARPENVFQVFKSWEELV